MDELRAQFAAEIQEAHRKVRGEPMPEGRTIFDHIFSDKDLVRGGAGFAGVASRGAPKGGA
jgi:hypothetical protein